MPAKKEGETWPDINDDEDGGYDELGEKDEKKPKSEVVDRPTLARTDTRPACRGPRASYRVGAEAELCEALVR